MKDFILSAFADEASATLEGQISALKRNNITLIELRNIDGKSVIDMSDDEIHSVKKELNSNGILVWAIGSPIGKILITDDFELHFKKFKRTVEIAKKLDCDKIRMFSFFIDKNDDPEKHTKQVVQQIKEMTDYSKTQNIYCCHENEKDIYGDISERVLLLHKENSDLKGIFDPANYVQCGVKPIEVYDKLNPFIEYLHIKDALLKNSSVVPAGKGDGSISDIITKFNVDGKVQTLTVEPHLSVFSGLDNLQGEELKHEYQYESQDEAFDVAVQSLKNILNERGFSYE